MEFQRRVRALPCVLSEGLREVETREDAVPLLEGNRFGFICESLLAR